MKPLISVVTINYNDLDGLYGTLSSIASQTTKNFELIVVDGHSNDGSAKLLEDFDPLIDTWVSEPDGGIYDAMNKGVALSQGIYVNFMNAGDCFYDERALERATEVILTEAPSIFCGHAYAQNSGKRYQYNDALWKGMVCSHQATFSKRELHTRFPFDPSYKIAADYRFYAQCETSGHPLLHTDIDLAKIDTSGVSFVGFEARTLERLRICRELYPRPEVYRYFSDLIKANKLSMPAWADSMDKWLHGA